VPHPEPVGRRLTARHVCPMDQRRQFVLDARRFAGGWTELCARYCISRRTCPHGTAPDLVAALLEAGRRHPSWRPRKLLRILPRRDARRTWPARSTAADLLRRHGCIALRPRRRHLGHPGRPRMLMTAPNQIWTTDFKGPVSYRQRDLLLSPGGGRRLPSLPRGCQASSRPPTPSRPLTRAQMLGRPTSPHRTSDRNVILQRRSRAAESAGVRCRARRVKHASTSACAKTATVVAVSRPVFCTPIHVPAGM